MILAYETVEDTVSKEYDREGWLWFRGYPAYSEVFRQ